MQHIDVPNAKLLNIVDEIVRPSIGRRAGINNDATKQKRIVHYLHITAEECEAIAKGLKQQNNTADPLVKNFFFYFDSVSKLGGCFLG